MSSSARRGGGGLPFVDVYEQRETEVVHGPSCRAIDNEFFVDKCAEDGVAIVERRGGGGGVVLSAGVLVIVVVGDKKHPREFAVDIFRRIHDNIIAVLKKIGVDGADHAGISDIAVSGKKILGSSLYMGTTPPLFYYQSSLMVSNNIELMDKYLRHPPREPDYRKGRTHSDFCTTLKNLGVPININELSARIKSSLTNGLK